METLIEAIQTKDLVKTKRCVNNIMAEKVKDLIEKRKKFIAESVLIEGEDEDEEDKSKDDEESEEESDEEESEEDDESDDDEESEEDDESDDKKA